MIINIIKRYSEMINVEMIEKHAKTVPDELYLKLRNVAIEVIEREDKRRGLHNER